MNVNTYIRKLFTKRRSQNSDIEKLKCCKPKEFWKFFKNKKSKTENSLSIDNFYQYFSNLENDIFTCKNTEAEGFCVSHNFDSTSNYDEFDRPICVEEI